MRIFGRRSRNRKLFGLISEDLAMVTLSHQNCKREERPLFRMGYPQKEPILISGVLAPLVTQAQNAMAPSERYIAEIGTNRNTRDLQVFLHE
jgi:hypothetical protein